MTKQINVLLICMLMGLGLLSPNFVRAQGFFWGQTGYVMLGPTQLNLPVMNQFLASEDFPLMSERPFSMELGFSVYRQNWVMGANLNNFMSAQSRFQASRQALVSLNYQYLNLYVGRILYRKDVNFAFYPTLGIAGGGAVLKYQPLGSRFPENYWTAGAFANGALNFSWYPPFPEAPLQRLHLGFSIGYNHALEQIPNSWRINNLAPDKFIPVEPTGPYIKIIFGMGKVKRRY